MDVIEEEKQQGSDALESVRQERESEADREDARVNGTAKARWYAGLGLVSGALVPYAGRDTRGRSLIVVPEASKVLAPVKE